MDSTNYLRALTWSRESGPAAGDAGPEMDALFNLSD